MGSTGRAILATLLRSGIAALAMGGVLWLWLRWLDVATPARLDADWVAVLGGFALGTVVYVGVAWLLRSEELAILVGLVRGRLGGRHRDRFLLNVLFPSCLRAFLWKIHRKARRHEGEQRNLPASLESG